MSNHDGVVWTHSTPKAPPIAEQGASWPDVRPHALAWLEYAKGSTVEIIGLMKSRMFSTVPTIRQFAQLYKYVKVDGQDEEAREPYDGHDIPVGLHRFMEYLDRKYRVSDHWAKMKRWVAFLRMERTSENLDEFFTLYDSSLQQILRDGFVDPNPFTTQPLQHGAIVVS